MYESFPGREKGIAMPKSRLVTRENAKKKKMEERVSMRSTYGYMDPTPYEAIRHMDYVDRKQKKQNYRSA